jgi:hypothetical protein
MKQKQFVGDAIYQVKKSKGAYKRWELILMTTIIVSGIIIQYGNVRIVISFSGHLEESTDILRNFTTKELHAIDLHPIDYVKPTDIVKQKELKEK